MTRASCSWLLALLSVAACSSGAGAKSGAAGTGASAGATGAAGATGQGGSPAGTAGVSGAAGRAGSGGAGAIDGGVLADGGTYYPDPVRNSEGDATLQGTDSDNDGIRDDVAALIPTLEADPTKRTALASFARESTAMMVLGGTTGTTKAAALAQVQRVGRTLDCLYDLYAPDLAARQVVLIKVRSGLYNNAQRLAAYNHASTLVSGSIFHLGHGCDQAITGVSR